MNDDVIKQLLDYVIAVIDMRRSQRDFYNGGAPCDYLQMRNQEKEVDYLTKELITRLKSYINEV